MAEVLLLCDAPSVLTQVFSQTSMAELRRKSKLLTAYTERLLLTGLGQPATTTADSSRPYLRIITPSDPEQRGSQLSIWFSVPVGLVYQQLAHRGVVVIYLFIVLVRLRASSFDYVYYF